MAKIEIDIDDNGNIGTLPEPIQKMFDKGFNEAFKKGAAKVEADLKDKMADPAKLEKLKLLEDENNRFKEERAKAEKNFEEADRLKEERYQKALAEKDGTLTAKEQEIARRDTRLRTQLAVEIKSAAVAAGARDESLPELMKLLGADLDLDPTTLEAFVKGTDGKPLTKDNKPVSIEGHVQQYLADHPHHLKRAPGRSGGAPGGQSMRGGQGATDAETAKEALVHNPTIQNLTRAISASRKKAS